MSWQQALAKLLERPLWADGNGSGGGGIQLMLDQLLEKLSIVDVNETDTNGNDSDSTTDGKEAAKAPPLTRGMVLAALVESGGDQDLAASRLNGFVTIAYEQ